VEKAELEIQMTVRLSHHAIQRIRERFSNVIPRLLEVIERGIFENDAVLTCGQKWEVDGLIDSRPVRVVYVLDTVRGVATIVTVMWLRS
jgi:hypothetical protein